MSHSHRANTAILISGRGSNMVALLEAAKQESYPCQISLVFSNRPEAAGLQIAKQQGIKTATLDHKQFKGLGRQAFEEEMDKILTENKIEWVVLAGFMRLLTPWFVERWYGKLINIHPSLLPAYKGLDTHERVLAEGTRIAGCTVHFVSPEMDAGPIIAQAAVAVEPDDTPETLGARVLKAEHELYPAALSAVASKKLYLQGNKVIGKTSPSTQSPLFSHK